MRRLPGEAGIGSTAGPAPKAVSALPMYAQQVFFGVVMRIKVALVRVADSLANAVRKMNISGSHQQGAIFVHNGHDALQRVLRIFPLLYVAHEAEDFGAMVREEFAFELDVARGKVIMHTVASRAHLAMCWFGFRQPLPPALVKDCAAAGTKGRLMKLAARFIAVMDVLMKQLTAVDRLGAGF